MQGEGELEGEWLDKIVGLNNVKDAYVMLRTPDGGANIELVQFYRPSDESTVRQPLANTPGIRHIAFVVEDIEAHVARLKKQGMEVFSEVTGLRRQLQVMLRSRARGHYFRTGGANQMNKGLSTY